MANWKQAGFKSFDVPGFVDFMVERRVLKDVSKKGDVAPRFNVVGGKKRSDIGLLINHPIADMRDAQDDSHRYVAYDSAGTTEIATDDLQEALIALLSFALTPEELEERFHEEAARSVVDDLAVQYEGVKV